MPTLSDSKPGAQSPVVVTLVCISVCQALVGMDCLSDSMAPSSLSSDMQQPRRGWLCDGTHCICL